MDRRFYQLKALSRRSLLACSTLSAVALPGVAQAQYQETAQLGVPASWQSAEYTQDWGLNACAPVPPMPPGSPAAG